MTFVWFEDPAIREFVASCTGSADFVAGELVQSLWSGYGEIRRVNPGDGDAATGASASVIAKWIDPPVQAAHPRGWSTPRSHQRKLTSYEVEKIWYRDFAKLCPVDAQVPSCLGHWQQKRQQLLLLSDLDSNYPLRFESLGQYANTGIESCLKWLASFHANFMGNTGEGLWPVGTYWYLATRPDEYDVMEDGPVKEAAEWLDKRLSDCPYQTLVHGDAKVANFCFSQRGEQVAAVDFQYVGGGVGIRDVVYLLSSCLDEEVLFTESEHYLDTYFEHLHIALENSQTDSSANHSAENVCKAWRELYAVAWTDFYRFLLGWMPDHPKTHRYTKEMSEQAIAEYKNSQRAGEKP